MLALYHNIIYLPLYNVLVLFYNIIPFKDFGVAIILTTILIRLFLYPISKKQIQSQKKLQTLQPEIKKVQEKHKDNKEEQAKAMMALYKEHRVNPISGCLPLIFQILFFIAIYRVIINISRGGFMVMQENLYSFVHSQTSINHLFLGVLDLTVPSIPLAVFTAIAQYFQMKMIIGRTMPAPPKAENEGTPDFASIMNKQMLYVGPALSLFIGITFPAALSLYWLTSTLFMLLQQKITFAEKQKAA